MPTEKYVWCLTDKHINDLQSASIERVIARLKQAHWTNIQLQVRINGGFETIEADWLKHLKPVTEIPDQRQLMDFYAAKDKDELIERLHRHIERLQEKLPAAGSMRPEHVREG
jgi:ribosome-associated translation inhibitor RaiA